MIIRVNMVQLLSLFSEFHVPISSFASQSQTPKRKGPLNDEGADKARCPGDEVQLCEEGTHSQSACHQTNNLVV